MNHRIVGFRVGIVGIVFADEESPVLGAVVRVERGVPWFIKLNEMVVVWSEIIDVYFFFTPRRVFPLWRES